MFRLNVTAPPAGGKLQFAGDRASAEGGPPGSTMLGRAINSVLQA
jgi:hypothetical protein